MIPKSPEPRIAFYAGSFDPFTVGHLSVAERGAAIFDAVVIGVGINSVKAQTDKESRVQRLADIRRAVQGLPNVTVTAYTTLTAEAARMAGARWLLRGVRSVADYEYERNMAELNRRISGLETVLLFALPEQACISSSAVRELTAYGVDVSDMIP